MHTTAFKNCIDFFNKYISSTFEKSSLVIDFGSYDVNGTLKPIFKDYNYKGIDMCQGPNVDIVCTGDKTPFSDNEADVVLSSSNFEHDECFWMTFLEMCRIVKSNGYIYINAPSAGEYHAHPGDCWRFYADSWKALEKWAIKNNYNVELVETYIDQGCSWKNSVGIFKKM